VDKNAIVQQLEGLLAEYQALSKRAQHKDLSDLPETERQALVSKAVAAVHRVSGPRSSYSAELERLLGRHRSLHTLTSPIMGLVQALLDDVKDGHLQSLVELVHAETFSDFLDMAARLNGSGYKDPAAVIAGSALEVHLRALCTKSGLPTESTKADGSTQPKKADLLNNELCQANVYSKLDQKSVIAWLDLRNKAAHGKYAEYQREQVVLQIGGIRDFIVRNPA
jgi:hypothetical protein